MCGLGLSRNSLTLSKGRDAMLCEMLQLTDDDDDVKQQLTARVTHRRARA